MMVKKGKWNCRLCMKDLEQKLRSKEWKREAPPLVYWYEMAALEEEHLKEIFRKESIRSAIEVGCGPGRILRTIKANAPGIEHIVGVERNPHMRRVAQESFPSDGRIEIKRSVPNVPFDLSLSMLCTAGNQKDTWTFVQDLHALSKSITIFSLYKKGVESERREIYASFGHLNITEHGGCIRLNDGIVQNLRSRAFSYEEISEACRKISDKYEIEKEGHLSYIISLNH